MVHIYSLSIINKTELKILNSTFELGQFSFWEKQAIRELCGLVSIECAKRCETDNFSCLEKGEFICYVKVYKENDTHVAIACVCDLEYPVRIMQVFVDKAYELCSKRHIIPQSELNQNMESLLNDYRSPEKCGIEGVGGSFTKFLEEEKLKDMKTNTIKSELDSIRLAGIDSINKLIMRDEDLTDLILKTNELSNISQHFVDNAHEMNRCCILL